MEYFLYGIVLIGFALAIAAYSEVSKLKQRVSQLVQRDGRP